MSIEIKELSDLFDGKYNETIITGETFEGSTCGGFSCSVLNNVAFRTCTFLHAQFVSNNMNNVQFEGCEFIECKFIDNKFNDVIFDGCDLSGRFEGNSGECTFWSCAKLSGLDILDNDRCAYTFRSIPQCDTPNIVNKCPSKGNGFIAFKRVIYYNPKRVSKPTADDPVIMSGRCVLELWIPPDAERIMCIGTKGRCDKALVKRAYTLSGADLFFLPDEKVVSAFDHDFQYHIGEWIEPDWFDDNPIVECSHGIHFFMSFHEAAEY